MTERLNLIRRSAAAAVVFASLAASGFSTTASPAHAASQGAFPTTEAERVLAFGFDVITERYLEPVTVLHLALEGLRGLGSIDPGLAIRLRHRNVELSTADRVVVSYAAPPLNDAEGWAEVAVRLTLAARSVSPAVAQASAEDLYEAIFDAILADLDGFSRYAGAAEARKNRARRNGFGGVGIRYTFENGRLFVKDVLPDTPADAVGLAPGDMITRIDGVDVASFKEREEVSDRMRGPINSILTVTVDRGGRLMDLKIRRGLVVPQTVTLESLDDGIVHIRISSFNQRTTKAVAAAVDDAKRRLGRNMRGVLLDLRGNPGGLLDQAVGVSDLFMTRGRIVFTKGRHPEAQQSYTAEGDDIADGLPMVVMLDGRSASAAEIVAAALQDGGRAVVVGSASYGKGTVQTVVRMPNNGEMTLTWSRFHSPSGYALHGLGVLPTVCVTEPTVSADVVLEPVTLTGSPISAQLAMWRSTPLEDKEARQDLRSICPPTNQADWASDTEVARRLLSDHALFARALSVTAPKSASAESHF